MKLSKEELKKKITEVVADEDIQIALLEDIEDSFVESEESDKVEKTAYDEVVAERDEIKRKYKGRDCCIFNHKGFNTHNKNTNRSKH